MTLQDTVALMNSADYKERFKAEYYQLANRFKGLKKMLAERGQDVSVMVDLEVPEDELMVRLIKRGKDSGRADDNEETIKKRLHVYHSQTSPLIDWYKNEKKYQHINGLGTMDGIFADICEAVDKL